MHLALLPGLLILHTWCGSLLMMAVVALTMLKQQTVCRVAVAPRVMPSAAIAWSFGSQRFFSESVAMPSHELNHAVCSHEAVQYLL